MDNTAAKAAALAEASSFIDKLNEAFLFPLIFLMMGIALLFFIYGTAQYIINADSETGREDGKKNIMYGILGLVIMGSAYAILGIAAGTFGLRDELDCAADPTSSGCGSAFVTPR